LTINDLTYFAGCRIDNCVNSKISLHRAMCEFLRLPSTLSKQGLWKRWHVFG